MIIKTIIEKSGGIYLGRQESHFGTLILFNDPLTGSTLALPEHLLTPEAVTQKILDSRKTFT